jgi:transposase
MEILKIKQKETSSLTLPNSFIGIDVSMSELHISRRPSEGESAKQGYGIIPNSVSSITELVTMYPEAHYVFEATGVYSRRLEYTLSELQKPFSKVNGLKVKGFITSIGALKKNDCLDAIHIREYGEKVDLKISKPLSSEQVIRQRHTQALGNIEKQLQNIDNQGHLLDNEAFEIPTLRESYSNIKAVLLEEKAKIQAYLGTLEDDSAKEGQALLKTIIGIGDVCAKLLWEATNGFQDFDKAKQVARFLGVVPVDEDSGKIRRKKGICQTAYPTLRAKLYVAAGSAIQYNPFCQALYQRLRARGKSVKLARIAVVHKLIRIAFGVVKSGKPFDPFYNTLSN